MNKPAFETALPPNYALDIMLIGVAVEIEPSDHDEKIANKRYQLLEKVLTRPKCILKNWLLDHTSSIYAQGSFASGTLIVSGEKADRFDVDAIVQFSPSGDYSSKTILDALFHDLQGFPGSNRDDPARSGLCLFDPDQKEWNPRYDYIAKTTIPWVAKWLANYEYWHLTGDWIGEGVLPATVREISLNDNITKDNAA